MDRFYIASRYLKYYEYVRVIHSLAVLPVSGFIRVGLSLLAAPGGPRRAAPKGTKYSKQWLELKYVISDYIFIHHVVISLAQSEGVNKFNKARRHEFFRPILSQCGEIMFQYSSK